MTNSTTLKVSKELNEKLSIICILNHFKKEQFVNDALTKALDPYKIKQKEIMLKV